MSSASPSSGQTSGPTSAKRPAGEAPLPGEAAAAAGSPNVDAYLRKQADEARSALLQAATNLKAAMAGKVDPLQLPRKYPFIAVGAVAAASFVAAVVAIPSREQQELKRLERIRRAMHPDPEPAPEAKQARKAAEAAADKAAKPPLWVTLLKEGVQAARPLLVSLVTASIKAKQDQANPPPPPDAD